MTTSYEGIPPLDHRLASAELIVLGTVRRQVDVELHALEEAQEVHSVFTVAVDRVLAGSLDADEITVRVVGGSAEGVETKHSTAIAEGRELLLLLSRDVGPGRPETAYVPFFGGCYATKGKAVALPEGRWELAKVKSAITAARRNAERERVRLEELEPARLRRLPYPAVLELPEEPAHGASAAAPAEPDRPAVQQQRRGTRDASPGS